MAHCEQQEQVSVMQSTVNTCMNVGFTSRVEKMLPHVASTKPLVKPLPCSSTFAATETIRKIRS